MENELKNELLLDEIASEDESRVESRSPPMFQYYQLVMETNEKAELPNDVFYVNYDENPDEEQLNSNDELLPIQNEVNEVDQVINVSKLEPITLPDGSLAYLATNGPETEKIVESGMGNETVFLNTTDSEELPDNEDEKKEMQITLPDGSIAYIVTNELRSEVEENTEFLNNINDADEDTSCNKSEKNQIVEVTLDNDLTPQVKLIDGSLTVVELKTLRNFLNTSGKKKIVDEVLSESETLASTPNGKRSREKLYPCTYLDCGKFYTTMHHLKVHERTHTGDRPFKCDFEGCNKSFTTTYSFKVHKRIHTGEKPYECTICMKTFYTSGDLQKHTRIHTGERPFVCPMPGCNLAFTTSNIRKVHIRTHTGERPFKCNHPSCDKTFVSKTNYTNHLRIHSGERPYVCPEPRCLKRFTEYSSLYKHQIVHQSTSHKVCSKCGTFYWQRTTLKQHMKICNGTISVNHELSHQNDDMATLNKLTAKMSPTMTLTSANIKMDVNVDIDDSEILLSSQTDDPLGDDKLQLDTEDRFGDVFYISKHGNILPTVHLLDE